MGNELLRWMFYVSVAACLALLGSKCFGFAVPGRIAFSLLGSVPLIMAARHWSRSFSIRDCAIHLDRLLGLDERLSTALEASGVMAPLLLADADGALRRAPIPPRRFAPEGKLLGGSLVLLAVLGSIPSPERSGARVDPAMESLSLAEARKLESLSGVDVQFKELAEAAARQLRGGNPEESLALLEELKRKLAEQLLETPTGAAGPSQLLLDQATSSAAAVSAELARLGRTVHAPPPVVALAKLHRQKVIEQQGDPASEPPGGARAVVRSASGENVPWHPRYDPVMRKYFGREP
jgi:hypothetical protein